jgi:hypothetical protein
VTSRGHDSQQNILTTLPHHGTRSRSLTSRRRAALRGHRAGRHRATPAAVRLQPPCFSSPRDSWRRASCRCRRAARRHATLAAALLVTQLGFPASRKEKNLGISV